MLVGVLWFEFRCVWGFFVWCDCWFCVGGLVVVVLLVWLLWLLVLGCRAVLEFCLVVGFVGWCAVGLGVCLLLGLLLVVGVVFGVLV